MNIYASMRNCWIAFWIYGTMRSIVIWNQSRYQYITVPPNKVTNYSNKSLLFIINTFMSYHEIARNAHDWNDLRRKLRGSKLAQSEISTIWTAEKVRRKQFVPKKQIVLLKSKSPKTPKKRSALKNQLSKRSAEKKKVRLSVSPSSKADIQKKMIRASKDISLLQWPTDVMPEIPAHYCCHALKQGRKSHSNIFFRSVECADGICRWKIEEQSNHKIDK